MGDIAKWALLVAGIVAIIALIVALPFVEFINVDEFGAAVASVVNIAGSALRFGRGLINNFFSPFGRNVVTGLLYWLLLKPFLMTGIKAMIWVYHYIFK